MRCFEVFLTLSMKTGISNWAKKDSEGNSREGDAFECLHLHGMLLKCVLEGLVVQLVNALYWLMICSIHRLMWRLIPSQ
jgi:hypothetical protein